MKHLQDLKKLNINATCRTCLENLNEMYHDIFDTPDLQKKFTVCTSFSVEQGDEFPTNLCESCHTKINDFYNFKQMCISSMKRFQDYIESEEKPCTLDMIIDSNNTNFAMFKEAKKEDEEDPISHGGCSESDEVQLSNVKNLDESSSEGEGEESDNNQPILKRDVDLSGEDIPKNIQPVKKIANSVSTIKLECEICKKCFKNAETFDAHMRVHQGLKPFPCQHCDKSYAGRRRLRSHIREKHEGRPQQKFPCTEPGCKSIMSTNQTLRQHMRDIHSGNKTKQSYICEECGKVLKSLTNLKNHSYLHTGQQLPHECQQCHKRYITKGKLREHMNRHAGIRKYICPHCGARKTTRNELKNHINYHTKEKTYRCQFCDIVFNSIGNFSRHKRIVHEGIKDYPCSYCEKSFGKAETRKHHEMTHTGEKPHECKICHKKFIQLVALKKHTKIHFKGLGTASIHMDA